MPRSPQRDAGLQARHTQKLSRSHRTCRYVDSDAGLCTGQATEDGADILLCIRHLALALQAFLPSVYAKIRTDVLAEVNAALGAESVK